MGSETCDAFSYSLASSSFDYGNAESTGHNDGDGTMEAMTFGNATSYWKKKPTNGTGPWVMADIENGMYPGDDKIDVDKIPTMGYEYATAMLKGHVCEMAIKGGDATQGKLISLYDGVRPEHGRYDPMRYACSTLCCSVFYFIFFPEKLVD